MQNTTHTVQHKQILIRSFHLLVFLLFYSLTLFWNDILRRSSAANSNNCLAENHLVKMNQMKDSLWKCHHFGRLPGLVRQSDFGESRVALRKLLNWSENVSAGESLLFTEWRRWENRRAAGRQRVECTPTESRRPMECSKIQHPSFNSPKTLNPRQLWGCCSGVKPGLWLSHNHC